MALERLTKHPNETRLYTVRLNNAQGLTVVSSAWAATPSGLTFDTPVNAAGGASCLISGGTDGGVYQVEAALTLSDDEVLVKEFEISVIDT